MKEAPEFSDPGLAISAHGSHRAAARIHLLQGGHYCYPSEADAPRPLPDAALLRPSVYLFWISILF